MRTLFLFICLANIAVAVAVPFLADVQGDDFKALVMASVVTAFVTVFYAAFVFGFSWLTAFCPKELFNIPNRDYWLNDENRARTTERFRFFWYETNIAVMFFILFIQAGSIRPSERFGTVATTMTVLLCVFVTFETVRLYLSYRLPKNTDQPV